METIAEKICVEEHFGLVYMVAKRFLGRGLDMEELFQIGCVGLVKASQKFDPTLGVCFSTYAVPMILGEIRRIFRDDGQVHVSRSMKEQAKIIKRIQNEYEMETGCSISFQLLCEKAQMEPETVIACLGITEPVKSLEEPLPGKDGNACYMKDFLKDESQGEEYWIKKICLEDAMKKLEEKEEKIIFFRYFEDRTQKDVANSLNLSQAQVSRIEKRALAKMQVLLRTE